MTDDSRASAPMPSPVPPPPPRSGFASRAEAETDVERAMRIALEARSLSRRLDAELGRDPDPDDAEDEGGGLRGRVGTLERTIGRQGSAIHGTAATGMLAIVLSIRDAVTRLEAVIEAEQRAHIEAAARRARLVWALGIPLAVAALLGAGAYAWRWIATLHH